MPGLRMWHPDFTFSGNKVEPEEIDMYRQYTILNPSISATWVGTTSFATASTSAAMVLINAHTDYPRNLLYAVAGSADIGGTWTVNGKNQFGEAITESVTLATTANGATTAGTAIFAYVTSGTFSATSDSVGNSTTKLGVAIGTAATAKAWFGLPDKIAAVTDVKLITWSKENVTTTFNGGSITSAHVSTTLHAIAGTAIMGGTEAFTVLYKTSRDRSTATSNQAGLP